VPISKYESNKTTLTNRYYSNHFAINFAAQYRFWNRLGFELGVSQHNEYLAFNDDKFSRRNVGFVTDISSRNSYWSGFGAIQYLHPITTVSKLYFTGGYSLNWVNGFTSSASKTAYYIAGQETVTLKNDYFNNASVYGEIGIEGSLANDAVLSVGLKYNVGKSAIMSGDYTVTHNGTPIEHDNITSKGSYIGLTLKYGFPLYHREKRIPVEKPLPTPKVVKPKEDIKVKPPKDSIIPKTVDGRAVNLSKKITVKNSFVTIKVWDHEVVDGDIVSLNLNGKWILQNYTLEKAPKEIKVTLSPGTNYLVLHAHNLGLYSPNTAAIIVDDGVKENKVILQSNLNASGTIQIDLK
jgi:hypothetical protein